MPGRFLIGDEVSDHTALVEAKLKGRLAPASKDRLKPLRDAYGTAASISFDADNKRIGPAGAVRRSGPSR